MFAPEGRLVPSVAFAFVLNSLVNFYPILTTNVAIVAEVAMRKYINDSYVSNGRPAGIDINTGRWLWTLCLNGPFLAMAIGSGATAFFNERFGRRCESLYN